MLRQEMSRDISFTKILNYVHAFPISVLFLPGKKQVILPAEKNNQMDKSAKKYYLQIASWIQTNK